MFFMSTKNVICRKSQNPNSKASECQVSFREGPIWQIKVVAGYVK